MTAQAQECVFEGLSLPVSTAPRDCLAQLHLAQEAAQVRTGGPIPEGVGPLIWAWPSCSGSVGRRAWARGPGWSRRAELGAKEASVRTVSIVPQPAVVLVPVGPPQGQRQSEQELWAQTMSWARLGVWGRAPGNGGEGRRLLGSAWLSLSWSPSGGPTVLPLVPAGGGPVRAGTPGHDPASGVQLCSLPLDHLGAREGQALPLPGPLPRGRGPVRQPP